MNVKTLFAIVLAAALAGIGVRLASGPKISGATTTATRDRSTDTCGFLASLAFSASEHERERLGRHQRRMCANPGWAMHEHVDVWRDLPGLDNS